MIRSMFFMFGVCLSSTTGFAQIQSADYEAKGWIGTGIPTVTVPKEKSISATIYPAPNHLFSGQTCIFEPGSKIVISEENTMVRYQSATFEVQMDTAAVVFIYNPGKPDDGQIQTLNLNKGEVVEDLAMNGDEGSCISRIQDKLYMTECFALARDTYKVIREAVSEQWVYTSCTRRNSKGVAYKVYGWQEMDLFDSKIFNVKRTF